MKKILSILTIIILALAFVPKDGFCDGHDQQREAATHQHCSVICHACYSAVVPVQSTFLSIVETSTLDVIQLVSYQNPTITRLKRPPIQIS